MTVAFPAPQVHKAVLREGGRSRVVAVKVRHPGVASRIKQDFQLLIPLARYTSRFKSLKARRFAGSALPWVYQFRHEDSSQQATRSAGIVIGSQLQF